MERNQPTIDIRAPLAGFLGWLVPGLGHILIGDRSRGLICFVTITATFWTGVAIGGVGTTIDPHDRTLWFAGQLCAGGNTIVAYMFHETVVSRWTPSDRAAATANWASSEVGVHYTGVAGLLNILVVLDAIARAEVSTVVARIKRRETARSVT
ncbi:MAG: hypothetical protein HY287_16525 [Planctomycetes bacterium]|nr:hypothetical protein [Planctomycetota bacterium]MBI3835932.1 hypothetical protein [Planctomycetota bacterium]